MEGFLCDDTLDENIQQDLESVGSQRIFRMRLRTSTALTTGELSGFTQADQVSATPIGIWVPL